MFIVFFIGGPLNNELLEQDNLPPVIDVGSVVYYPDGMLRTGIPVYSCLWGLQCRERFQRAEKPPNR